MELSACDFGLLGKIRKRWLVEYRVSCSMHPWVSVGLGPEFSCRYINHAQRVTAFTTVEGFCGTGSSVIKGWIDVYFLIFIIRNCLAMSFCVCCKWCMIDVMQDKKMNLACVMRVVCLCGQDLAVDAKVSLAIKQGTNQLCLEVMECRMLELMANGSRISALKSGDFEGQNLRLLSMSKFLGRLCAAPCRIRHLVDSILVLVVHR